MVKEFIGSRVEEESFEKLGVSVTIPPQADGKPVFIHGPLPYPFLVNKSPEPGRFDLIRLVVNFQVTEGEDGPVRYRFDPPMKVEVRLTNYEFGHLEDEQELKLAFWDETKPKWVLLSAGENFVEIDRENLLATVWISDWSDATMGVGR